MPGRKRKSEGGDEAPPAKKSSSSPAAVDDGAATASSSFTLLDHLTSSAWKELLKDEFSKPYFKEVERFLSQEYSKKKEVFPPRSMIFSAMNSTAPDDVKVVLLGQDPYHDNNQAHGLSFSVQRGIAIPPSLRNIYQELSQDIPGFQIPTHGNLESWAGQGVLLLNATLTVEAHKANSHSKVGWQKFTDAVIRAISEKSTEHVVFLLWGGFAHKKESLVAKRHTVIKTAHPSPLAVTKWRGCRCFSQVNAALTKAGRTPVDWSVPK